MTGHPDSGLKRQGLVAPSSGWPTIREPPVASVFSFSGLICRRASTICELKHSEIAEGIASCVYDQTVRSGVSIARKLSIACKPGKLLASQFLVNLLNLP